MKAAILSAGAGQRLQPLSCRKPKALMRVNGIPLLEHQIRGYLNVGLNADSICVVAGHQYNHIKTFIANNHPQVRLVKNEEYRMTNNMYSLYLALQDAVFDDLHDGLYISNGDCIYEDRILKLASGASANVIVGDTSRYADESMKVVVEDGRITDIDKTISAEEASAVSIDLYKLDTGATKRLRDIAHDYIFHRKEANLWTEVALRDLLKTESFSLLDIAGAKWAEIDTIDDLIYADMLFSHLNIADKKCFFMDLDGTVYVGNRPVAGTVEFIKKNMERLDFYFVTNNTSKLPEDYVEKLDAIGIGVEERKIITPIAPLLDYLKSNKITKVCLLANSKFAAYLQEALPSLELPANRDMCEALIVAFDTDLTYDKLRDAVLLLQRSPQMTFLATHSDLVCPTENGFIPDIGCILFAIEQTTGQKPTVVFGKPNPVLLERLSGAYNKSELVIVGDRMYTDKKMAQNVGCDFICVLSGETTREQLDDLSEEEFPSLVVRDLGQLLTR